MGRTVQFWQVVKADASGGPLPGIFPATEWARALRKMKVPGSLFEAPDGWRMMAEGIALKSPAHIALYRIRREGLPFIESGGQFSDLKLSENENLAEATHLRFFPRNVIGLLYNHDGPHAGRIPQYLMGRFKVKVAVVPILRKDVALALESMTELSVVDLAIPVDRVHLLKGDGSDAIKKLVALAEESESKVLRVKFSLRGSKTPGAGSHWLKRIQKIAGSPRLGAFSKLRVKGLDGDSGKRIPIDLIAEHLTTTRDVKPSTPGARAVSPTSAAKAIQEAYSQLEKDIQKSVPNVAQSDPPLRMKDLA